MNKVIYILSDVRFLGLLLMVLSGSLLLVACDDDSDDSGQGAGSSSGSTSGGSSTGGSSTGGGPGSGSGKNKVSYGGQVYPLKSGLEEVIRPKSRNNHSLNKFNVTNGTFYLVEVNVTGGPTTPVWRAKNASVWFYLNLYSPGLKGLKSGRFNFASGDKDASSLKNKYFFQKGKFAVDVNGDGQVESKAGEFLKIVGGQIVVEKEGASYKIDFNFSLENGVTAKGSFLGDFKQV